ncbi:tetratricopeptide repeat protein [Prosthecobacter sp.]|uniref:tetratricopeptide repeat protein n=1 Tax=Prosthecobacter sp. TaxID=1965333 RepID=UPI002489860E|nr:tetratricopeptide repeat protein [Prosthecobacter sp.]MDI1314370.1 tetratricopeptide repeat protein [Prosthecobacter sp.]
MITALLAPALAQAWFPHAQRGAMLGTSASPATLADDVQVSRWLAEWEPVVLAQIKETAELPALLARETAIHDACLMLSLAVDDDVTVETKLEIATDFDEMLSDAAFERGFSALWHSRTLSQPVIKALQDLQSTCTDLLRLKSWLALILQRQNLIGELCLAWDLIPSVAFQGNSREMLRDHCRVAGHFLTAAEAIENDTVESYLADRLMLRDLPSTANARILFTKWLARFRHPHHSHSPVADDLDREESNESPSLLQQNYKIHAVLTHVEQQKIEIKQLIDKRDIHQAEKKAQWLQDYQRPRGGHSHLAKSLCDLASHARKRGFWEIALKWAKEAGRISPDDPVTGNERAECLRRQGNIDEALQVYEQTRKAHPHNPVTSCGYAECLRQLDRLDEALQIYDQTRKANPHEPVPSCGYAECLRQLGRLDEALQIYDQTRKTHPHEPVPQCGYAECLREVGHIKEALQVYDQTREAHPHEPIPQCGYAECLREVGSLNEALQVYDLTRKAHPHEPVPHCGYAKCLRDLGRFDEALVEFEFALKISDHNNIARNALASLLSQMNKHQEALDLLTISGSQQRRDWFDIHLHGMILLRMGRWNDAEEIFLSASEAKLISKTRNYFNVGLALCRIHQKKFKEAMQHLETSVLTPRLEIPFQVLRAHAMAASGRNADSRSILNILHSPRKIVIEVATEIRHRFFDHHPRHDEAWLLDKESELVLCA